MNKTIVHAGQSFLNKVIECTGNIENAFEMALLNGISITDNIPIGMELQYEKSTNTLVTDFFKERKPATKIISTPATVTEIESVFAYKFSILF